VNELPIHATVYFRWIIAGDELLERLLCSPQVRQSLHSSDTHTQKRRSSGAVSFPLYRAMQNAELVAKSEDLNLRCGTVLYQPDPNLREPHRYQNCQTFARLTPSFLVL
jgi:hypothetical protein